LLVEDTRDVGEAINQRLVRVGHSVDWETDGLVAAEILDFTDYDLIILDVMLPGLGGFDILRRLRAAKKTVPVLVLTARSEIEDRVSALDLGADDYLVKPFSIEELLLKIEIFLKRSQKKVLPEKNSYTVGAFEFDAENYTLSKGSSKTVLTQREAELLKLFLDNKNTVLKREQILTALWGTDDYFMGRSLDVFISRLRKLLSEEDGIQIENLHGIGFKFNIKA
ncbi:MAG: response regulator transcription factor, partial [Flavobacterium sp.]|nr:response regulator transcription factor [Flavobacterium sp.]